MSFQEDFLGTVTADRSEAVRNEILNAGCQILHKPVKPWQLRKTLCSLLKPPDEA